VKVVNVNAQSLKGLGGEELTNPKTEILRKKFVRKESRKKHQKDEKHRRVWQEKDFGQRKPVPISPWVGRVKGEKMKCQESKNLLEERTKKATKFPAICVEITRNFKFVKGESHRGETPRKGEKQQARQDENQNTREEGHSKDSRSEWGQKGGGGRSRKSSLQRGPRREREDFGVHKKRQGVK